MFTASTRFIKNQLPGLTLASLMDWYERELEIQSVNNLSRTPHSLQFSNNILRFGPTAFASKFTNFSLGEILFTEEADEWVVRFEGTLTRLYTSAGIYAGAATLLFLFVGGVELTPFVVGLVLFVLLTVLAFLTTRFFFPVYFHSLRNDFERDWAQKNK